MTIGGVQLIMIGIVGEYIGKILSELKARPIYFVAEHSVKADRGGNKRNRLARGARRPNERRRAAAVVFWLCADDYGLSPGVNRAIRDLIERGRLNATSVMVVGPAIGRDEVSSFEPPSPAVPAARSVCTSL